MFAIKTQNVFLENVNTYYFKHANLTYFLILSKLINALLIKTRKINQGKLAEYDFISSLQLNRKNLYKTMVFLAKHNLIKAQQLIDIIACDIPGNKYRFTVHYQLLSIVNTKRWHVYTYTNEVLPLPSIAKIFASATWAEREVWDMYGIFFNENSDLRRILSDYGFQGHPFRKDFPMMGFIELQYHEIDKLIKYEKIEQTAEYRKYKWSQTWNA